MVEAGLFRDERVELLRGLLVEMSPQDPRHSAPIDRLTELLVLALAPRARVRVQLPVALSEDSEPEPDLAVVAAGDYDTEHPTHALLVIEVAGSSLRKDRGLKASLYAEAGVPEYWIVDLAGGLVEVYTDIVGGVYARMTPFRPGESIRLVAFPDTVVAVSDILR